MSSTIQQLLNKSIVSSVKKMCKTKINNVEVRNFSEVSTTSIINSIKISE